MIIIEYNILNNIGDPTAFQNHESTDYIYSCFVAEHMSAAVSQRSASRIYLLQESLDEKRVHG